MKKSFEELEEMRLTEGPMASRPGDRRGVFSIRPAARITLVVIADDGTFTGWEHVSVVVHERRKIRGKWNVFVRTPTWPEMCIVKDAFWARDECVVQFHPAISDYVNNHPHCLHLWRHTENAFPTPPPMLLGFTDGGAG